MNLLVLYKDLCNSYAEFCSIILCFNTEHLNEARRLLFTALCSGYIIFPELAFSTYQLFVRSLF